MLILTVLIAIVLLLILISWFKVHPFVSLMIVSIGVGFATGMPLDKIIQSIKDGLGSTLSFLAIVLTLGTMLGKLMAESGGAEQIAHTLIRKFGQKKVHWAMVVVGFLVGLPVFFQVGFVLMIPLVFIIAIETGASLVMLGVSLVAGLSVMHGLVPPHPAALATVGIYKADIGLTILYAIIVGLPTALIAGPIYGKWIGERIQKKVPEELAKQIIHRDNDKKNLPSFGITLFTILLPVALMLIASIIKVVLPADNIVQRAFSFVGDPVIAMLIATIVAFFTLGYFRNFSRDEVQKFVNDSLGPTASILLIIGAGGAFNKVLLDSGIGKSIANLAAESHLAPIFLAWGIAALIRVATGSATVSMITAAGIVAPIAAAIPGTNLELLTLATGAGSLILSHVNDSGFWMIKEYFGMSVKETFLTWTVMETIISIVAFVLILLLNLIV